MHAHGSNLASIVELIASGSSVCERCREEEKLGDGPTVRLFNLAFGDFHQVLYESLLVNLNGC